MPREYKVFLEDIAEGCGGLGAKVSFQGMRELLHQFG